MARGSTVAVKFTGDVSHLNRSIGEADSKLGKLASGVGNFAKVAAVGLAGAGVAGVALAKGFVEAAVESEKIAKQTEAVIKSTGGAANVTADQIGNLADSLAMKTGVDDELIASGANVLLTFTKVRNEAGKGNDIFDQATKSALDMSVALGTDLTSANMLVGKALNDPIKGMATLTRSGVQFTDQQKEQVKALVASGDVMGAQKIILGELSTQFGGSAEAQATAGDRLKVVWGNVQEELGKKLLPVVEKVATFLADHLPGAMQKAADIIGPIAAQVSAFFKSLFSGFTEDEGTKVERVALTIRDVLLKVWDVIKNKVAPVVKDVLIKAFQTLRSILMEKVWPAIKTVWDFLMKNKEVLVGVAVAIGVGLVAAFLAWAASAGAAAVATIAAMAPIIAIGAAIAALVAGVIYAYQNWDWFHDAVNKVRDFLVNSLWPAIQTGVAWIMDNLVPAIQTVIGWLVDWGSKIADWLIPKLAAVASFIITEVVPRIGEFIGWIAGIATKIVEVATSVYETFEGIVSFVTGLPGRIASAASGMWNGIKDAFIGVINFIIRAWNNLEFSIPSFDPLGDYGPSIGGQTLGLPDIPLISTGQSNVSGGHGGIVTRLASGGIVSRPLLSIVGDAGPGRPELVGTEQKFDEAIARVLRRNGVGAGGVMRIHPDDLRALAALLSPNAVGRSQSILERQTA